VCYYTCGDEDSCEEHTDNPPDSTGWMSGDDCVYQGGCTTWVPTLF
jgi:hypothetical protein